LVSYPNILRQVRLEGFPNNVMKEGQEPNPNEITDTIVTSFVEAVSLPLSRQEIDTDFVRMAEAYKPILYTIAFRILGNYYDAKDAVQDGLINAYTAMTTYSEEQRRTLHVQAWLCRIVANAARNIAAKNSREQKRNQAPPDLATLLEEADRQYAAQPENNLICYEELAELADLIESLPRNYKIVVILRVILDLSYQEIATVLDWPLNRVKVNIHRSVEALRIRAQQLGIYLSNDNWTRSGWDHKRAHQEAYINRVQQLIQQLNEEKDS
jgi:RNA polymerase sigma-70 factor (ECF subfamily)